MSTDYYRILGVKPNASEEEIHRAYRRCVIECHPDLHPGLTNAKLRLESVIEARRVLTDPVLRMRHDRELILACAPWRSSQSGGKRRHQQYSERAAASVKALVVVVALTLLVAWAGIEMLHDTPSTQVLSDITPVYSRAETSCQYTLDIHPVDYRLNEN